MNPVVERFLAYLDASPTSYHAVQSAIRLLEPSGFTALDDGAAAAPIAPGTCGWVARQGSLIAFRMGTASPLEAGFRIVAAHTDSPNLRVKPQPVLRSHGYVRLGLEVYGGVLLATWPDRDLGIAGSVVLRDGDGLRSELVDFRRPLCRIANLAIHLNRGVNKDGLTLNEQTHLPALLALGDAKDDSDPVRGLLCEQLDADPADILTWDLSLYDLTPARLSGLNKEFLHSARLDNLGSCHAAVEALLAATAHDPPECTAVVALFDHEEVGSTSHRGARGRLLQSVLERLAADSEAQSTGGISRALANSVLVSSDMSHAVHPAYADKHDSEHMPKLNEGPVIKQHIGQRYSTEATTAAMFLRLCELAEVPCQWFVNRQDLACGSTVGPMVAANLGIPSVDVGNPMLSMHSAREMCGSHDQPRMVGAMTWFLRGAVR